jgi:alpha-L-rhamnosidase
MLRYFDYLEAHSEGGFVTSDRAGEWCLSDWCTPDPILLPPPFINNYFYIRAMRLVMEMARLFGHEEDIPLLEARIKVRLDAIRAAYYDPKRATFFSGCQGADAFGLDLGLGDDKTAAGFLARYESLGYYDTGIFGTDIVTRLLFEQGRGDIALRLLTAHEPHGFGAWMRDGATTFREYWGTSRSHSHPMFGSVVCYLFEYILVELNEEIHHNL